MHCRSCSGGGAGRRRDNNPGVGASPRGVLVVNNYSILAIFVINQNRVTLLYLVLGVFLEEATFHDYR